MKTLSLYSLTIRIFRFSSGMLITASFQEIDSLPKVEEVLLTLFLGKSIFWLNSK